MSFVYQGSVMNKASIAILKRNQEEKRKAEKTPSFKGMSAGKTKTNSTKLSHDQRRARVVARSIEADPKKNSGFSNKRAVK